MSILIRGMEMPQTCRGCQFCHFPGRCFDLTPVDNYFKRKDRPSWCPIIEVPKHGDLIDRDETMNEIFEARQCYDAADFAGVVNAMPSIIESEE